MKQQNQESPDDKSSREELFRVKEKICNTTLPNNNKEQGTSGTIQTKETDQLREETMSSNSNDSLDVAAINFKKYLIATGVRYIKMGQASHVQSNNERNLDSTPGRTKTGNRPKNHRHGNHERRQIA